jgi:uncharacterized protein YjbJ (UPF0337 family)
MEEVMDWNRVQGSWKQLEGKVKAKWGKLTADDLTAINGRREELEGKIQQRYGIAQDQARKEIDDCRKAIDVPYLTAKYPSRSEETRRDFLFARMA